MNIGSFVFNSWQGLPRFGTVTDKRLDEKGWAHYTVDWHDDAEHKQAAEWQNYLRRTDDAEQTEYRADELSVIDPSRLDYSIVGHIETLSSLNQRVH